MASTNVTKSEFEAALAQRDAVLQNLVGEIKARIDKLEGYTATTVDFSERERRLESGITEIEIRVRQLAEELEARCVELARQVDHVRVVSADDVLGLHRRLSEERPSPAMQQATLEGLRDVYQNLQQLRAQLTTAPQPAAPSAPAAPAPTVAPAPAQGMVSTPVSADGGWQSVSPVGVQANPQVAQPSPVSQPGVVTSTTMPAAGGWQVVPPPGAGR